MWLRKYLPSYADITGKPAEASYQTDQQLPVVLTPLTPAVQSAIQKETAIGGVCSPKI